MRRAGVIIQNSLVWVIFDSAVPSRNRQYPAARPIPVPPTHKRAVE